MEPLTSLIADMTNLKYVRRVFQGTSCHETRVSRRSRAREEHGVHVIHAISRGKAKLR
jgi:hypothetical protein